MESTEEIRLTQFSKGAGCGCKIAPAVLQEILKTDINYAAHDQLLVGNTTNDDAAAYDMGNGTVLIATNDFFTPIVDDAFDFGRIAAANAISDVYAMGGQPIMATAILGWPVEKLPVALAQKVLEGARTICEEAGIPLAGGHSIDVSEPIFGLSVNGICDVATLKRNNTAQEGDVLFLTKPIGVGILATAQKKGILQEEHRSVLIDQLTRLNKIGQELGKISGITAMTDVTGFGLGGHLIEMADGAGLSAELYYSKIGIVSGAKDYIGQRAIPDATYRNWNGYGSKINFESGVDVMEAFSILPDPQTNGGLLIAVAADSVNDVTALFSAYGYTDHLQPVGRMITRQDKAVIVKA